MMLVGLAVGFRPGGSIPAIVAACLLILAFAAHQPVTVVVNAARGLMLGPDVAENLEQYGVFNTSTTGYVLQSLAWIAAILAVFVPLAVREFNKS